MKEIKEKAPIGKMIFSTLALSGKNQVTCSKTLEAAASLERLQCSINNTQK